jgi:hypothetical protein
MANLVTRLRGQSEQRSAFPALSMDDYLSWFSYAGSQYPINMGQSMPGSPKVEIANDFAAYVHQVYLSNGVVGAAVTARALLLSELRFRWRNTIDGELFGDQSLALLERPGGMTRPELLHQAEQHASLAGSAFFHRQMDRQVRLLRPDWTDVVIGTDDDVDQPGWYADAEVVGYLYTPGGAGSGASPLFFMPDEVAHWKPEPDPENPWRGLSWVQSVLLEVSTDQQAIRHVSKFYEHAATPNLVFVMDKAVPATQVAEYAEKINERHAGVRNAYRNMVIGGGADVKVVGADLAQLDYRKTQGMNETRIAMRSRVPAVILQIAEGLGGSALNAGNYSATRRMWSDSWFSPYANSLCAALERIVPPARPEIELSFDPAAVMFLQEDRQDEANIRQADAATIRQLIDAGYDPLSVVDAVTTGDFKKLAHSGLYSVQLQPAGATGEPSPDSPVA